MSAIAPVVASGREIRVNLLTARTQPMMDQPLQVSAFVAALLLLPACSDKAPDKVAEPRTANVIDDAYKICAALEVTDLTTDCKVHGWDQTIDATIDTTGSEARKLCAGVVKLLLNKTPRFKGEWRLRILSPYSGKNAIAICTLG
jgi:hypothetical protein